MIHALEVIGIAFLVLMLLALIFAFVAVAAIVVRLLKERW